MKIISKYLTVCAIVTMAAALAAPTDAAFPGKNGRIAFVTGLPACYGGDVYSINPDGKHLLQLTHYGPTFHAFADGPNWSADGRKIVFQKMFQKAGSPGTCFGGELWIMDSDGSHLHRILSEHGFADQYPSFSPDGTAIVFSRALATNTFYQAIYRVNVDGTGLTPITHYSIRHFDFAPAYSPDGKQIAFSTANREGFLWCNALMRADGSNIHLVTPGWLGANFVDWSPDGRQLVFWAYQHGVAWGQNEELWSVDLQGDGVTRLTKNNFPGQKSYYAQTHDFDPGWSPDGTAIVFTRDNGSMKTWGLYVMQRQGATWTTKDITPAELTRVPEIGPVPAAASRGSGRDSSAMSHFRKIENDGYLARWGTAPNIGGAAPRSQP